jgi:hypothetical protein
MRWLLLVLTLSACVLCVTRHSPGAMAWWLVISVIGAIATALAFVQFRINGSSRGDQLSEYELRLLRECNDPRRPGDER